MAEKQNDAEQDSCRTEITADSVDVVVPVNRKSRRYSSSDSDMAPPNKSPRTGDFPSHEVLSGSDGLEMQSENVEEASRSSSTRRKSWRRATLTRRSLPSLPNPYQKLCRGISTSIPNQERLDKLLEASMKLAVERLQNTLQSVPNSSMESFQKRVDSLTRECASLPKTASIEAQNEVALTTPSDPKVQTSMEKIHKAINRLKAESNSWEALLDRHRSKAEELQKKVAEGPLKMGSIDDKSIANSSQYQLIKDKPNYCAVLSRQQPMLQSMEMIMDAQSKMVRELLSIKEQSHLIVKETSVRLATAAGFQDLPHDSIRKLLGAPKSSGAP